MALCAILPIGQSGACPGKGGVKRFWLNDCTSIDWDATAAIIAASATHQLTALPVLEVGAPDWAVVTPRYEGQKLDFNKPNASSFYDMVLTGIFNGLSAARTYNIKQQLNCCCLAIIVEYNDGTLVFIGKDFDPELEDFVDYSYPAHLESHLMTSGDFAGDRLTNSRDEIGWSAQSAWPPVFCTFAASTIPTI